MKRLFFNFFFFVLITGLMINFVLYPLLEKIFLNIYRDEILLPHRELFKGFFRIMTEDLLDMDASRRPEQLHDWQGHFKFDIEILPLQPSHFSNRELTRLAQGKIVMRGDVDISGNRFYQRIGDTGSVLQIGGGAFADLYLDEIIQQCIVWGVMILYFSIPVLIYTYPFWRRLKRIRAAAMAFGRGEFEIRVRISRYSSLFPIARAFNQMADRIRRLIAAHQRLNRAVSRELRRPVARIRIQIETLLCADEDGAYQDCIPAMENAIDDLDGFISRLLTYARNEAAPPRLSIETQPLAAWLAGVVAFMADELDGKAVYLFDKTDRHGLTVRFDPQYMGRAVADLLRNAAVYCRSRVDLTVVRQKNFILLHVDDDGPGIPAEQYPEIFEPFIRKDAGGDGNKGGLGLGLATVKSVLQWHHGSVAIGESPLGGARFTLTWPGITGDG